MTINSDSKVGSRKRENYIDFLRAVAIICVVMSHVDGLYMNIGSYDTPTALFIYLFNLPLFFFLSGLFAPNGIHKGFVANVTKKARQLLVPTIFVAIIAHFMIGYDVTKGYGAYWFSICLFVYFLVYFAIEKVSSNKYIVYGLLFMLSISGIAALVLIHDYSRFTYIDLNRWSKYFQYFALGVFISKERLMDRIFGSKCIQILVPVSFFTLFGMVSNGMLHGVVLNLTRDIVLRYLSVIMIVCWTYQWREKFDVSNTFNKYMNYIGTHTLEIYLLHFFFIPNLNFMHNFMTEEGRMFFDITFSLIVSLVIIAFCLLICTLLERNELYGKYVIGKTNKRT